MNRTLGTSSKASAVLKNPCLKSTIEKLFEDRGKTGDIKFIIDAEEIRAHRCVLAALSPKYEAQFYGPMQQEDTITVEDVSPAAFMEFLQFFYTTEVTMTLENIEDVLNLAKQSLVDEIIAECANFLMKVVGLDKLLWCYRLALVYDVKPLEKFCVQLIGTNIESVFQSGDFLSCDHDTLCHVLDLDSLDCKEGNVFEACILWAKKKCDQEGTDAADAENLRAALRAALFKIRFCSMEFQEFAAINRKYSGLLSAQESTEVFQTIALKANGVRSIIFGDSSTEIREPMKCKILECSFGVGSRIPIDSTNDRCINIFEFTTDKAITLKGFVICNKITDDIEVRVKYESKCDRPKNTISISENETKITFDNSIPNIFGCAIRVYSKGFEQFNSNLYGFKAANHVFQNGVSFQFSEIVCKKPSLITGLLFDVDDEN